MAGFYQKYMNTRNQYIIMGVLVIAMLLCSLYIWDHDRKLPKEEEYIYEPFKSEDVDFWIKGGGNILGPPEDPIDYTTIWSCTMLNTDQILITASACLTN